MSKFKVGDTVEVVGNKSSHGFDLGTHVTILRHDIHDGDYECHDGLGKSWYLIDSDMAPTGPTPALKKAFEKYDDFFGKPDGGPAEYYDFPKGAITLNDLIEHKGMDFHRGNIFKACWRWGTKTGTSTEYDARKIIYSGARLLMKIVGVQELRKTLQKMLDDPQFQVRKHD